ncbi:MAG: ISAs1 family transposase [Bacteroidota bacterium]
MFVQKANIFSPLSDYLSKVPDFRNQSTRNFRHPLLDILLLSVCGIFCGAEDIEEIALFGKEKEDFLRKFIDFPNGIPSHDTIRRVFMHLDAESFNREFMAWVQACISDSELEFEQISIDGKVLKGSKSGIHLVSAVASELGLSLGQVKTSEKSNEITAIPKLLDLLVVKGCIVSIDAMGTQHEITDKIIDKGGDYFLALKGNQKSLHKQVQEQFERKPELCQVHKVSDWTASHNQAVGYEVQVCEDFTWVENKADWNELNSLVKVITTSEKRGREERFYISSIKALSAEKAHTLARGHWAVENKLHWQLDVTMKEDKQRHRSENVPENISLVRKMVLNIAKMKEPKLSRKKVIKKMAWNQEYFIEVMRSVFNL